MKLGAKLRNMTTDPGGDGLKVCHSATEGFLSTCLLAVCRVDDSVILMVGVRIGGHPVLVENLLEATTYLFTSHQWSILCLRNGMRHQWN